MISLEEELLNSGKRHWINFKDPSGETEREMFFCVEDYLMQKKTLEIVKEELGIDIPTLVSALKNGIWVKTRNGISQHFTVSVRKWLQTNTYCLYYRPYTHVWFKDYGKTWALTREELEKSKKDHQDELY